jgi:hypothetical protein
MVVSAKYIGTDADKHDMEKLQLDQVLRVSESFGIFSPIPDRLDSNAVRLADGPL